MIHILFYILFMYYLTLFTNYSITLTYKLMHQSLLQIRNLHKFLEIHNIYRLSKHLSFHMKSHSQPSNYQVLRFNGNKRQTISQTQIFLCPGLQLIETNTHILKNTPLQVIKNINWQQIFLVFKQQLTLFVMNIQYLLFLRNLFNCPNILRCTMQTTQRKTSLQQMLFPSMRQYVSYLYHVPFQRYFLFTINLWINYKVMSPPTLVFRATHLVTSHNYSIFVKFTVNLLKFINLCQFFSRTNLPKPTQQSRLLNVGMMIRQHSKCLFYFPDLIARYFKILINQSILSLHQIFLQQQKWVLLKHILTITDNLLSIMDNFLQIILMFIQKLNDTLISQIFEIHHPFINPIDHLQSNFSIYLNMIYQLNQFPISMFPIIFTFIHYPIILLKILLNILLPLQLVILLHFKSFDCIMNDLKRLFSCLYQI